MTLHVDMDAFYAAVEERDNPALRGKPVIVGGDAKQRGVVSTANYIARQYGVHSAMPAIRAKRLCPNGIFLRGRMNQYVAVSRQIRNIFARYTPCFEPLSLDEAFLDVSGSTRLHGEEPVIARKIKTDIKTELNLIASVGVAPNKFLAKLASDLGKPDGYTVVDGNRVQNFLDPLPVSRLWGVGKVTLAKLHRLNIHTFLDLRQYSIQALCLNLGDNQATHLRRLSVGEDDRVVTPDWQAKSISHETTFAVDISDLPNLLGVLIQQTDDVAMRLRRQNLYANTVQLKLRYSDFRTITRASKLTEVTSATAIIWQGVKSLMLKSFRENDQIRLLGMGVTGLTTELPRQQDLFAANRKKDAPVIDEISDRINKRFGKRSLVRGLGITNPVTSTESNLRKNSSS